MDAWYSGKSEVDYDKLEFGDEVPKRSAWILGGQVVVFRPKETDAYCVKYEGGEVIMQIVFRTRS